MPTGFPVYDDRQMNDDWSFSDVGNVPLIAVFDMSPQDGLQINISTLFLCSDSRGYGHEQCYEE